jgi:hypothetical protein
MWKRLPPLLFKYRCVHTDKETIDGY